MWITRWLRVGIGLLVIGFGLEACDVELETLEDTAPLEICDGSDQTADSQHIVSNTTQSDLVVLRGDESGDLLACIPAGFAGYRLDITVIKPVPDEAPPAPDAATAAATAPATGHRTSHRHRAPRAGHPDGGPAQGL